MLKSINNVDSWKKIQTALNATNKESNIILYLSKLILLIKNKKKNSIPSMTTMYAKVINKIVKLSNTNIEVIAQEKNKADVDIIKIISFLDFGLFIVTVCNHVLF